MQMCWRGIQRPNLKLEDRELHTGIALFVEGLILDLLQAVALKAIRASWVARQKKDMLDISHTHAANWNPSTGIASDAAPFFGTNPFVLGPSSAILKPVLTTPQLVLSEGHVNIRSNREYMHALCQDLSFLQDEEQDFGPREDAYSSIQNHRSGFHR